jgi:MarR family transcriptional regulator for hemolysin
MPTSPETSQRTLTALLAPLSRTYRRHIDRAFLSLGISHTLGLPVMMMGRLGDGIRQGALVEALGIEPPSLVPLLDQLERAGLAERRPCAEDKRAKTLHLTETGRELASRAETAAAQARQAVLKDIPADDLATTVRVLGQMQAVLDKVDG